METPGANPLPETSTVLVGGPILGSSVIVWLKAALVNSSTGIRMVLTIDIIMQLLVPNSERPILPRKHIAGSIG
jgi:hypothetical protein